MEKIKNWLQTAKSAPAKGFPWGKLAAVRLTDEGAGSSRKLLQTQANTTCQRLLLEEKLSALAD